MAKKSLEEKTADAILQRAAKVKVGDKEYEAAPPTIATLVLVSEAVAKLPHRKLNEHDVVSECLSVASDCKPLGDIAAILILGAKHVNEPISDTVGARRSWIDKLLHRKRETPSETKLEALSRELLENCSPRELHGIVVMLLQRMELSDFFAVTTFLSEINLLRATKVVTTKRTTKTTVSGQ